MPSRYEPLRVKPRVGDWIEHPSDPKESRERFQVIKRRSPLAGMRWTVKGIGGLDLSLGNDDYGFRILKRKFRKPAAEITALRQIVSDVAANIGNGAICAPTCTLDFMRSVAREVGLVTTSQRAEITRLRAALEAEAKRHEEQARWFKVAGEMKAAPQLDPGLCEALHTEGVERAAAIRQVLEAQ